MSKRVALITGGSSGIGRATAITFVRAGYRTIVADVNERGGQETVDIIASDKGDASFFKADVSKEEDVVALIDHIKSTYGRLDAAFNNAGIDGDIAPFTECSVVNWDRVIGVNLRGTFLCCKYEIPLMLEGGGGCIVNCSSVVGKIGHPLLPAYSASKHGVMGLTKSIAVDMASRGIRCNAVNPGIIQTAMVDHVKESGLDIEELLKTRQAIGRVGRPEEIAGAVLWLCSDAATLVNGIGVDIDGCWLAG